MTKRTTNLKGMFHGKKPLCLAKRHSNFLEYSNALDPWSYPGSIPERMSHKIWPSIQSIRKNKNVITCLSLPQIPLIYVLNFSLENLLPNIS